MNTILTNLRYAFRVLRKSPGFTLVAAVTLALGIASTTAIFSVVDQVLLHSLPYPHSDRIVYVSQTDRPTGEGDATSPANYLDWLAQNRVFSQMAAPRGGRAIRVEDGPNATAFPWPAPASSPWLGVVPSL